MGNKKEMLGKRFGRYLVIAEDKRDSQGAIYYKCLCDCGTEKIVRGSELRAGNVVSCGCYNREIIRKKNPRSKTKLYGVYLGMKQRCGNPNNTGYPNYGGRGIKVCSEWDTFENFREWAEANGYKEGLTIERIDVNGNYEPTNCRWATRYEQQFNKRTSLYITIDGVTKNASQWADETGINRTTLLLRIRRGLTGRDIIKPVDKFYSHGKEIKKSWDKRKHDGSRVYVDKDKPRTEITIETVSV